MAEAQTTTRPARKRAAAKTPTKTAQSKAPVEAPAEMPETTEVQKITFALDQLDDTKTYSVFQPPASSGCVGKLYVPKGVTEVKILLIGPKG